MESLCACISGSTHSLAGFRPVTSAWLVVPTRHARTPGMPTTFARASCRHKIAAVILHLLAIEGSQQARLSLLSGAARPLRHLKNLHALPDRCTPQRGLATGDPGMIESIQMLQSPTSVPRLVVVRNEDVIDKTCMHVVKLAITTKSIHACNTVSPVCRVAQLSCTYVSNRPTYVGSKPGLVLYQAVCATCRLTAVTSSSTGRQKAEPHAASRAAGGSRAAAAAVVPQPWCEAGGTGHNAAGRTCRATGCSASR